MVVSWLALQSHSEEEERSGFELFGLLGLFRVETVSFKKQIVVNESEWLCLFVLTV